MLLISCKGALLRNFTVMKNVHLKQSAMEDATIIVIDNVLIGKDIGPQDAIVSYKDRGAMQTSPDVGDHSYQTTTCYIPSHCNP